MSAPRTARPTNGGKAVTWILSIVIFFLCLDGFLAQSHLPSAGPSALRTVVQIFAIAQAGMFLIVVQMAADSVNEIWPTARNAARRLRIAVTTLAAVGVFILIVFGLPSLLLG